MKTKLLSIFTVLILFSSAELLSQSIEIKVSKDSILLGHTVTVDYIFDNIEGDYKTPEFKNAQICGTAKKIQSVTHNGLSSTIKTHVYTLIPLSEGKYSVPGLEVYHEDEVLKTDSVCIYILPNPEGLKERTHKSSEELWEKIKQRNGTTFRGTKPNLKPAIDPKSKRKKRKI